MSFIVAVAAHLTSVAKIHTLLFLSELVLTDCSPGALIRAGWQLAEIMPACSSNSELVDESKEYEDPVEPKSHKKTHNQQSLSYIFVYHYTYSF